MIEQLSSFFEPDPRLVPPLSCTILMFFHEVGASTFDRRAVLILVSFVLIAFYQIGASTFDLTATPILIEFNE